MLAEPGPNARLRGVLVAGIDGIQNYGDDDLNIERFEVLHNPCYGGRRTARSPICP